MFNTVVTVMSEACQECGICMAECPRNAIQIKNLGCPDISELIQQDSIALNKKTFIPLLTAFCCRRSAGQAKKLAEYMGHKLPQGLSVIEVPCAGSVSLDHIFSAFKYNSDGVVILTCHVGNCYSERGNIFAKNRADLITDFLSQIGFPKERILIQSLASNMGMEFYEITKNFEKKILELGTT
jgi:coenzyme F420-reducing hydrogenase delta subunit